MLHSGWQVRTFRTPAITHSYLNGVRKVHALSKASFVGSAFKNASPASLHFTPLHFISFLHSSFHAFRNPTAAHLYGYILYCQHTSFRLARHLPSHILSYGDWQSQNTLQRKAFHHPGKLLKPTHFPTLTSSFSI